MAIVMAPEIAMASTMLTDATTAMVREYLCVKHETFKKVQALNSGFVFFLVKNVKFVHISMLKNNRK